MGSAMAQAVRHNVSLTVTAVFYQFCSLFLLSFCYTQSSTHPRPGGPGINVTQLATILSGVASGALTLGLPYMLSTVDPLVDCVARILCFFFGCKILDLAVTQARTPPTLIEAGQPIVPSSLSVRLKYVWLLLTETRYSAFNIAVQQRERAKETSPVWTFLSPLAVPMLVFIFPSPETKSLMALLIIQGGLESLHALLHPLCPNYVFWQPFAATSLTSFWRTHWHAGAESFLRSLGYTPARALASRLGLSDTLSRALGVISAFNVTGIWHGWATAALATRPWMVGLRVWALFVGMGFGIVAEAAMPKTWRGSLPHRVFVWIFVIFVSGIASLHAGPSPTYIPSGQDGRGEDYKRIAKFNGSQTCSKTRLVCDICPGGRISIQSASHA